MVNIARLDDAFLEIFKLEASPEEEDKPLPRNDKKRRERKGEKKKKTRKA